VRCLLAEDDPDINRYVSEGLASAGYTVDSVSDGQEAIYLSKEFDYEVAVVDLGLPIKDGMDVIREIRASGSTLPIIVLTARSQVAHVVSAIEAGADDYLRKPTDIAELLAHIEAVRRRASAKAMPADAMLKFAAYALDLRKRELTCRGQRIDLTAGEMAVLEMLWRSAGEVVSKRDIAGSYQRDPDVETSVNSVEGLVSRLKRKCADPVIGDRLPIATVRGEGYLFDTSTCP